MDEQRPPDDVSYELKPGLLLGSDPDQYMVAGSAFYPPAAGHNAEGALDQDIVGVEDERVTELKQLADLKISIMQNIINEKAEQIGRLEVEVKKFMSQNEELKSYTLQSMQTAEQFQKVKEIIQEKEFTISELRTEIVTLDEKLRQSEKKMSSLLDREAALKQLNAELKEQLGEKLEADTDSRALHAKIQVLERAIQEKQKRIDIMMLEAEETVKVAVEGKDRQIRQLEEQISSSYQKQQQEIEQLRQHNTELMTSLQMKQDAHSNFSQDQKEKQRMYEDHLSKLQDMLTKKSELNEDLDQQNRLQGTEILNLKKTVHALELAKQQLVTEHKFELESKDMEIASAAASKQEEFASKENSLKLQIKQAEREKQKLESDLLALKVDLQDKEKDVKKEMDRIWNDWSEKHDFIEQELQQTKSRTQSLEVAKTKYMQELAKAKQAEREMQIRVSEKEEEIRLVQDKYESILHEMKLKMGEQEQKAKRIEEALQFEVDFLKKEAGDNKMATRGTALFSVREGESIKDEAPDKLISFRNNPVSPIEIVSPNPMKRNDDGEQFTEKKMDEIVNRAQRSISKVLESPFGIADAKPNDSLDAMRMEFMADYQKIIRESGETFFKDDHPTLAAQKQSQKKDYLIRKSAGTSTEHHPRKPGGALSQMVAAGQQLMKESSDVRGMQVENEQLKAMIEIMKVEMEEVLNQVKHQGKPSRGPFSSLDDDPATITLQKEIIQKERRIFDLEKRLSFMRDEVQKLRNERERLVTISSDLRAQLNKSKMIIDQLAAEKGSPDDFTMRQQRPVSMFENYKDTEVSNSQIIREDSKESLQDSSTQRHDLKITTSANLVRSSTEGKNLSQIHKVQQDQQQQLENLGGVVGELVEDIRSWIKMGFEVNATALEGPPAKVGRHNFSKQAVLKRAEAERSRSRGPSGKLSKDINPISRNQRSPSPETKMKNRGNEILTKLERLQSDLKVQGQALAVMEGELKKESRLTVEGKQNMRETESQKAVLGHLKRANEKKKTKALPVNYNAMKIREDLEIKSKEATTPARAVTQNDAGDTRDPLVTLSELKRDEAEFHHIEDFFKSENMKKYDTDGIKDMIRKQQDADHPKRAYDNDETEADREIDRILAKKSGFQI